LHDFILRKKDYIIFLEKKKDYKVLQLQTSEIAYWIWPVFWKKTNMTFVFFRGEAQKEKQPSPSLSHRQPDSPEKFTTSR